MNQTNKKRVLLVDNNTHYLKFIREQLLARDYEVVGEANDGEQAVALFASENPDLTLLDFDILNKYGTQVIKEILALNPDGIIIMLSGKGDVATMQLCLDLGAYHYIRKDYPLDTILSVIEESSNSLTSIGA
jgi:two-component system chemotaxis response regulator CheY